MLAKPRILQVGARATVSSSKLSQYARGLVSRKIHDKVSNSKSIALPNLNQKLLLKTPIANSWGYSSNRQSFRRFSTETVKEEVKPEEVQAEEVKEEKKEEDVLPENKEKQVGEVTAQEFQAETRKLLDIVARSLYTDKEVFVRELVSNSSDALEKLRHRVLTEENIEDKDLPLEINIYADNNKKTLIIQDSGIGMEKGELIKNLGSIGFSGSLEYIKNAKDAKDKDISSIIGQFGVGFYSSFMVANQVTVYSKSAKAGSKGHVWYYDGSGNYKIAEAEGVQRGTKIVIDLNRESEQFSVKDAVEAIIKKYSNFVGFPIKLNGKQVNTLRPLWTMSKSEVTEEDHKQFYQFIAHAHDNPSYYLHYSTDSPLNIRALFYVPGNNSEKFGAVRYDPGISLFCRKVMIQAKAKSILPEWMRFIRGVVDSEDIPLNLSREHLQDSALVSKLSHVLTKRILKWLDEESSKNPEKYEKTWNEFGDFLREGAISDPLHREEVGKLLRFDSSKLAGGKLCSFDDYLSRMDKDQKEIFYAVTPSRELFESSPYFEPFKARGIEVLVSYNTRFDEYVLSAMMDYKGKTLVSIDSSKAADFLKSHKVKDAEDKPKLSGDDLKEFLRWFKEALPGKINQIKESTRLVESPALIVDHESASFRRMLQMFDPTKMPDLPKQNFEVNSSHPVIMKLNQMRATKPNLARLAAEQIWDDALVAAGLMTDARTMLPRLNTLIASALESQGDIEPPKDLPPIKELPKEEKKEKPKRESKKKAAKEEAPAATSAEAPKEAAKEAPTQETAPKPAEPASTEAPKS